MALLLTCRNINAHIELTNINRHYNNEPKCLPSFDLKFLKTNLSQTVNVD